MVTRPRCSEIRAVARNLHAGQDSGDLYSAELRITKNDQLLVSERFTDERKLHARSMELFERLLVANAAEIRLRAERRIGELMKQQKETVGLNKGAKGSIVTGSKRDPVKDDRPTLAETGIDKHLADRARKLAAVPSDEFESEIGEWRERVKAEGARVTTRLQKRGEDALDEENEDIVPSDPW